VVNGRRRFASPVRSLAEAASILVVDPNPKDRIRAGIVGTGFAASSHIDALARLRRVEVAGVWGSSRERTNDAAERLDVRAFSSLDELLDDVDVVHNCTPNDAHAEVTVAALNAGVHVLSEKPLGFDAAEASRLAAASGASKVVTGVCFNYRHFPLVQQMKALLDEGSDGPVHLVHGAYLQDWLLRQDDWNWRVDSAKGGATRATGDIGSHWLDLVQHVTGQTVTSVTARLSRIFDERIRPPEGARQTFAGADGERDGAAGVAVDTEDLALVLFRTDGGVPGSVTISQVSAGWKNHLLLEIDTAEASFAWDQEEPNHLWIGRRQGANRDLVRDPSLLVPGAASLARTPGGHQEGWPDALRNLLEDFYGAVEAQRRDEPFDRTFASFGEAALVQATVEAILRSDATGTWVDVEDVVREVSS
jgi:predicted dehydrogenase